MVDSCIGIGVGIYGNYLELVAAWHVEGGGMCDSGRRGAMAYPSFPNPYGIASY